MRILFSFLLCLSGNALACNNKEIAENFVFGVEIKNDQQLLSSPLKTFQITSSIQKGDMFLRKITASVVDEFRIDLDFIESGEYIGGYYTSYLNIAEKYTKDLIIALDYNATNKDRNGFAMCANWVQISLTDLLQAPKAEKAPLPTSPPRPPEGIDV